MASANQTSYSLPTASRVVLTGLKRATQFNNREGVIIGAPTRGSNRYEVYLLRESSEDCNNDPIFIRVQPGNVDLLPATLPIDTSSSPAPLAVPHPLTTLSRMDIPDTISQSIAPATYFFGSVPPSYLLRGVPLSKKHAHILVLACGDIRSVLYTVSRRSAAHGSFPKIKFTLNDNEPCVIARNIILLWLILRTNLDYSLLFEIWFSLRISAPAYSAIVEAVVALTGPHRQRELQAIQVSFHSDFDRAAVYHFFNGWIVWRDEFDADMLFAKRMDVINSFYKLEDPYTRDPMADSTVFAHHIVGDEMFPKEAACREIKEYLCSGCVLMKHPQDYLNPTLFKSPTEYSLHYESVPYNAFPSFAPSYNEETPLRSVCKTQLKQWVVALRKHGRHNEYIFSTTDCLAFAMELTERFDIISMSNISDFVGLLPILQATRGLVSSSGYMFTKTFKSASHKDYIVGYLSNHLSLLLELVPGVLGWRCLGWDGKNNPDHCVLKEAPGSDGRTFEALLTWKTAAVSNVPLDAATCDHIQRLYTSVRDRMWMPLRTHPDDIRDSMLPLRVVNPLALLPVFASAFNVAEFIEKRTLIKDVEFIDVLGFVTTGTPNDVMMASVPIRRKSLCLWGLEPSDTRNIFTVRLDSGIPYTAIKARFDEEDDSWNISWMMSRERAKGVETVNLMYSGSVVVSLSLERVSFSHILRDPWDLWFHRTCSSTQHPAKVRRVEREDSFDIIFDISQDCVDAGWEKMSVRSGRRCDNSIEVSGRNPDHSSDQKLILYLPYPIDGVGEVSRDVGLNEAKFEGRKAKYSNESLFLADSHNKTCFFETTKVPLRYVHWLMPQQLSPNELLRSELGKLQWTTLGSCKGVASSIFRMAAEGSKEPIYLQSDDEDTGHTQSLMLFAGPVRRDECTGNLAVDVKWMHKPRLLSRAMRNKIDWPSYPPMTQGEFQAVIKMLEVRSEHNPETEEIRSGFEFMAKSQAMWRHFPGMFDAPISETLCTQDAAGHTATDRMHLLSGGRIGYAVLTALMWPGQVAFLQREGSSLVTNMGGGVQERVEEWLKRGSEHERRGNTSFALLAFEQGAGQGLMLMRVGERLGSVDPLVECLLGVAATRLAKRDRKDCPLISACCNKAIDLARNSGSCLRRKAERLLSKAVDVSQVLVSSQ